MLKLLIWNSQLLLIQPNNHQQERKYFWVLLLLIYIYSYVDRNIRWPKTTTNDMCIIIIVVITTFYPFLNKYEINKCFIHLWYHLSQNIQIYFHNRASSVKTIILIYCVFFLTDNHWTKSVKMHLIDWGSNQGITLEMFKKRLVIHKK